MSVLERIKEAQFTINLFFETIAIIPFQVALLYSALIISTSPKTSTITFIPNSLPYLASYFVLTIFYCVVVSVLFKPKRVVSPINVQIGTWTALALFEIASALKTSYATNVQEVDAIIAIMAGFGILLFLMFLLGLFQLVVVTSLVGQNLRDMDRVSYSINSYYKTFDNFLSFLTKKDFARQEDIENKIVYKTPTGFLDQVVLVLGQDPKDEHKSILATVAYHRGLYEAGKSDNSTELRDSYIYEIRGRLMTHDPPYMLDRIDEVELKDSVSTCAYVVACTPTRSKIESASVLLEKIPTFYKALIYLTILVLVGINVAFWEHYGNFDFGSYVSVTVFLAFAILVEAGIPLREEVFKKKAEKS
jgi:hypothetical protein